MSVYIQHHVSLQISSIEEVMAYALRSLLRSTRAVYGMAIFL